MDVNIQENSPQTFTTRTSLMFWGSLYGKRATEREMDGWMDDMWMTTQREG
jgi:hypothetical protein